MIKSTIKDIDKILSFALIFFSLLFLVYTIIIERPLYTLLGFIMICTGLVWLYSKKKAFIAFDSNYTIYVLLNIIFFVFFSVSLLTLFFRPEIYVRPLSYFIIISLMVGIVALEIFFSPSKKFNIFILLQVIIIGLSISLSQLFLFSTVLGIDPWWHQMFSSLLIEYHHIPGGGYPYAKIPIFHLLVSITSIITGWKYSLSAIASITIPLTIICVLLTYNIGKYLINDKIGLLGSLILVFSNYFINGQIWTIPTTLGGIFLIAIIYLLLFLKDKNLFISSILALFLMFVLILTHTIVSLVMSISLTVGWVSLIVYKYSYEKIKGYFSWTIALYFTVAMLGWWIYASGTIVDIVDLLGWGLNVDPSLISTPKVVVTYLSRISLFQQIYINLGTFIFFSLSIFGVFFLISKKNTNHKKFIFALIAITPLLISFISIISGKSIIEGRWLYIAQILLAVPVAIAINAILNHVYSKKFKIGLLFGIIFCLSFLMIMNQNVANIDNNLFYESAAVRYGITDSELASYETFSRFNVHIMTDEYNMNTNSSLIGTSSEMRGNHSISNELYNRNITNLTNKFILIRSEVEKNPFKLYGAIYKLDYNITEVIQKDNFSVLYDSGSVKGYYKFIQ